MLQNFAQLVFLNLTWFKSFSSFLLEWFLYSIINQAPTGCGSSYFKCLISKFPPYFWAHMTCTPEEKKSVHQITLLGVQPVPFLVLWDIYMALKIAKKIYFLRNFLIGYSRFQGYVYVPKDQKRCWLYPQ